MTKYRAVKTVVDGINFDSKKEAAYYVKLKLDVAAGHVLYFLRQVPFHLAKGVTYRCDFMVVDSDGKVEFIDLKGVMTPCSKIKIKLTEEKYPVNIRII